MARQRPVFLPELGKYFEALRTSRGWSQVQSADIAKRRGIELSYQALRWLEEGKTKNPDPDVLRAVAKLYAVPYEDVVKRVVQARYEVDITATSPPELPPEDPPDEITSFATRLRSLHLSKKDIAAVNTFIELFERRRPRRRVSRKTA